MEFRIAEIAGIAGRLLSYFCRMADEADADFWILATKPFLSGKLPERYRSSFQAVRKLFTNRCRHSVRLLGGLWCIGVSDSCSRRMLQIPAILLMGLVPEGASDIPEYRADPSSSPRLKNHCLVGRAFPQESMLHLVESCLCI